MKLVLQRVANAGVYIEGQTAAKISQGLLIFFGVEKQDNSDKVNYLADKALKLRIFQDDKGKMNLSCLDVSGDVLVISQFTLKDLENESIEVPVTVKLWRINGCHEFLASLGNFFVIIICIDL